MNERPQDDRSAQGRPHLGLLPDAEPDSTMDRTLDPDLDPVLAQLRDLDGAPAGQAVDRRRQGELLTAVLSAPRRRPFRRVGWIAAAAVAVVAASLALPLATSGQPAFASWTPEPTPASASDAAAVRAACLDQVGQTVGGDGAPEVRTHDLHTRLSDRRGDWVSVLLTWTGPDRYQFVVACLGELPPGSADEPAHVESAIAGGGGWAEPTTSQLIEGAMAEFVVGGSLFGWGGEPVAVTNGDVGPHVVGVTIHAYGHTIEAVVADGTYAAWWPGRITDPDAPAAPSGREPDEELLRYDVTLRDGTVLKDVDPVHPRR